MMHNRLLSPIHGRFLFRRRLGLLLISLITVGALVGAPLPVRARAATTISVTTTVDEYDTLPDTGNGCSLREAVQAANDNAAFGGCPAGGADPVIELLADTYALTLTGIEDDTNATGDLDLDADMTINGAGQAATIIDGSALGDRILHVLGHTVVLNDLTITGGHAPDGLPGDDGESSGDSGDPGGNGRDGGGIYNLGDLTLNDCTISNCRAGDGGSGGQGQPGDNGTADGEDGEAGGDGGEGGEGGYGGGIYNAGGASLTLNSSTVSGNTSGHGGGSGSGGPGGNGASNGYGGDGGDGGSAGSAGFGGGIYSAETAGITLDSSLISGNHGGDGGDGGDGSQGGAGGSGQDGGEGGEGGDGGSGGWGGGLATEGPITATESLVLNNVAGPGGAGGNGANAGDGGPGVGAGGDGGTGGDGGGGGNGGGIFSFSDSELLFSSGTVEGNLSGEGGAAGSGGQGGTGGDGTAGLPGGEGGDGGDGGGGGSSGWGGGIYATHATITDSTIRDSHTGVGGNGGDAGSGGTGGFGGAGAQGGDGGEGGSGGSGGGAGYGGGLVAHNTLTLDTCTVSLNTAGNGGVGGNAAAGGAAGGGGIKPPGDGGNGGTGGYGASGGHGGVGGGIYASSVASVVILSSTIHGNRAGDGGQSTPGASGGAGGAPGLGSPEAYPGTNGDGGDGGNGGNGGSGAGAYLWGTAEVKQSTFSANICGDGSPGAFGGDAGSNTASPIGVGGPGGDGGVGGDGGGIFSSATLTMTNVTISGNSAGQGSAGGDSGDGPDGQQAGGNGGNGGRGGGLYNHAHSNADAVLVFTTIASNQAQGPGGAGGSGTTDGADGTGGRGGGVMNANTDPDKFHFRQTILGDNGALDAGPDCWGTLTSGDYNLVEDLSDCTLTGFTGKNKTGVDPVLAPLANNTGPTETHLPLPLSPAIDGNGSLCFDADGALLAIDQRGRSRRVDGDDSGVAQCDIGAVEVQGHRELVAAVDGEGEGNVKSTPPGIDCGNGPTDCRESYDLDTVVSLMATPDGASRFASWGGACSSTTVSCTVTMDASKKVTATFDLIPSYTLTVELSGNGEGTVGSDPAGITCSSGDGTGCASAYLEGTPVSLTATADVGSHFVSWGGACSGETTTCQVTVDADKTATATFGLDGSYVYLPLVLRNWP